MRGLRAYDPLSVLRAFIDARKASSMTSMRVLSPTRLVGLRGTLPRAPAFPRLAVLYGTARHLCDETSPMCTHSRPTVDHQCDAPASTHGNVTYDIDACALIYFSPFQQWRTPFKQRLERTSMEEPCRNDRFL